MIVSNSTGANAVLSPCLRAPRRPYCYVLSLNTHRGSSPSGRGGTSSASPTYHRTNSRSTARGLEPCAFVASANACQTGSGTRNDRNGAPLDPGIPDSLTTAVRLDSSDGEASRYGRAKLRPIGRAGRCANTVTPALEPTEEGPVSTVVPPPRTTGADITIDPKSWPPVFRVTVGEDIVATLTPMEMSYAIRDAQELLAALGGWNSGLCMNGRWPHEIDRPNQEETSNE